MKKFTYLIKKRDHIDLMHESNEEFLNKLGNNGWELIRVVDKDDKTTEMWFKKEKN